MGAQCSPPVPRPEYSIISPPPNLNFMQNPHTIMSIQIKNDGNKLEFGYWSHIDDPLHPTGTCTKDRNCQVNEVCDKGQCRDPCSIEGTCGLNAFCNVIRHKKQCVCPADFTGNPEVECVRIPSTCYSSSDCPQPMQCADGICMPPCNTDENCAINERCLQGLCMRKSTFWNHEA